MIYAKAKLTMNFGPHHAMYLYAGPMFASVQDDLGTRDGDGKVREIARMLSGNIIELSLNHAKELIWGQL